MSRKPYFLILFTIASLAGYGAQPEWTQVSASSNSGADEVALARTPDSTLHIVWLRHASGKNDYVHSTLSPDGKLNAQITPILTGWNSLATPALVVAPDGSLTLLYSGLQDTDSKNPFNSGALFSATSPVSGDSWTLTPGDLSPSKRVSSGPIAATAAQGQIYVAWPSSYGLEWESSLSPTGPRNAIQGDKCCTYNPNLTADGSGGAVTIAWHSNGAGLEGIYIQTLPSGTPVRVPDSAIMQNGALSAGASTHEVGLANRLGAPGVYVGFQGYCGGVANCTSVDVWPTGAANPLIVTKGARIKGVSLARGPEGRLWAIWISDDKLYAARSNKAATVFGRPVAGGAPVKTVAAFRCKGNGDTGPLDAFMHVARFNDDQATWHVRLFPELNLSASPRAIPQTGGDIEISVTDVGDPVAGATVTVGGQTLTTDASGHVTYKAPKRTGTTKIPVTASAPGYTGASISL